MLEYLKIGILGGGQLGSMLLKYAIDFGLNVSVMDSSLEVPCARYTSSFVVGNPLNYEDVIAFGHDLDILTIEKESVNAQALKELKAKGVKVYPDPEIIEVIQDKYTQKEFLSKHNIPVVPGTLVNGRAELRTKVTGYPLCLKKCRNGYDGKGVMLLHNEADIEKAFNEACVLEEVIDIRHELSVIVSRNEQGAVECYDPALMIFNKERMILDFQICPADIDMCTALQASNLAIKTAEALNLVGIMAVEMFVTAAGKIFVNELAPRPHNSGHHTIESTITSQYEQQIRLMLGLPMGSTKINKPSVMINILEPAAYRKNTITEALKTILCTDDVHLHWYGKKNNREGRKIGHITITEQHIEDAISKAVMIRHLLKNTYEEN